jgi:hypothetical protein
MQRCRRCSADFATISNSQLWVNVAASRVPASYEWAWEHRYLHVTYSHVILLSQYCVLMLMVIRRESFNTHRNWLKYFVLMSAPSGNHFLKIGYKWIGVGSSLMKEWAPTSTARFRFCVLERCNRDACPYVWESLGTLFQMLVSDQNLAHLSCKSCLRPNQS